MRHSFFVSCNLFSLGLDLRSDVIKVKELVAWSMKELTKFLGVLTCLLYSFELKDEGASSHDAGTSWQEIPTDY